MCHGGSFKNGFATAFGMSFVGDIVDGAEKTYVKTVTEVDPSTAEVMNYGDQFADFYDAVYKDRYGNPIYYSQNGGEGSDFQIKDGTTPSYILDPDRLYQAELEAFNNKSFDPHGGYTYCNRYAESVLRLYTGSDEFWNYKAGAAKTCDQIFNTVSKSSSWGLLFSSDNGRVAQELANSGFFVIAISTRAATPNIPNGMSIEHIAIIAPGQSVTGNGRFSPYIAQNGASKLLPGQTAHYTLDWGWRKQIQDYVQYYVKI